MSLITQIIICQKEVSAFALLPFEIKMSNNRSIEKGPPINALTFKFEQPQHCRRVAIIKLGKDYKFI